MNSSGVSVVLGSYNRKKFLKKTIQSIRNNNINREYEIIVIDGGSTDGSVEYLIKQKDIVTIIQHNHGKWEGKELERKSWGFFMNLGFKSATGKYICMISDDCLLTENVIEKGIIEINTQQNSNKKIGGIAFYYRDWPIEEMYKVHFTYGNLLAINHGIYTKEALESVGYINDKDYQFYCADGDLSLKIWRKGYSIIKSKNCFVEHHAHAPSRKSHSSSIQYKDDQKASKLNWAELIERTNDLGKWEYIKIEDNCKTVNQFPKGSIRAILKFEMRMLKKRLIVIINDIKKIQN